MNRSVVELADSVFSARHVFKLIALDDLFSETALRSNTTTTTAAHNSTMVLIDTFNLDCTSAREAALLNAKRTRSVWIQDQKTVLQGSYYWGDQY